MSWVGIERTTLCWPPVMTDSVQMGSGAELQGRLELQLNSCEQKSSVELKSSAAGPPPSSARAVPCGARWPRESPPLLAAQAEGTGPAVSGPLDSTAP